MKRLTTLLLALCILCPSAFALDKPLHVAALKGPTAMGLVKLMHDSEGGQDTLFTLASSPDTVLPGLLRGEIDVAFIPVSLAAILYANTEGAVRVISVNTLGALYLLRHGEGPESLDSLAGHTVYASGKASTPEHILMHLLDLQGLREVDLQWKSEHTEALVAFLHDPGSMVMLPQPFATRALEMGSDISIAVDLNQEWETLVGTTPVTGVTVARTELIEKDSARLQRFLSEAGDSVSWVNSHTSEAAVLIGELGILDRETAEKALPLCAIVHMTGKDMQALLIPFYQVLFSRDPATTGGRLPDDAFYYVR